MIRLLRHKLARAGNCAAPAAPARGARSRGRGCGFGLVLLGLSGLPAFATEVPVPSGQAVILREVLLDDAPGELWVRFRFIAPQIARDTGDVSYELAGPDMDYLCNGLALPYLNHHRLQAARVVISLSDRVVTFGQKDADATQFFETYTPDPAGCIWEEF